MTILRAVLYALALCVSSTASSQNQFWPLIIDGATGNDPIGQWAKQVNSNAEEVALNPVQSAEVDADGTLDFKSSPPLTRDNLAHFVAQSRAQNPAAAAQLEELFAQVDVVGAVSDKMRSVGLQPSNTADAYAVWWIIAWSAANDAESPEDRATFQAVSRQARAAFADTKDFAAQPDADKQQFAEALMVQAVLLDSANDGTRNDPALRQQLADQAKRGASEMGLDLTAMMLTEDGFRPR